MLKDHDLKYYLDHLKGDYLSLILCQALYKIDSKPKNKRVLLLENGKQ